jgi:hypothetical protein
VPEDSWVVLVEHIMNTAWVQIDDACLQLLALESELDAHGIESAFDPFRPGEGGGYTRTLEQPVRLMVKQVDVERAREIAVALAAEMAHGNEQPPSR